MTYDFFEQLNFSQGVGPNEAIQNHLLIHIPGAIRVEKSTDDEDRHGTDDWIVRDHGLPPLSVDYKHRTFDPIERFGTDDVCIETCSVFRNETRERIGWTLDPAKRTDLVIYTWPAGGEARRFWILHFPILCSAARRYWMAWRSAYGEKPTPNNGYVTLNVYVHRQDVARAMKRVICGVAEPAL